MAGSSSTFLLTGTTAGVVALLTLGLTRAARKSGLPHSLAPAVAAGMLLWLGAAAILARSGVLSAGTASPPRWPLLPLTALALLINAIGTVATSAPGPLPRDWPGEPFVAIAVWPVVWIPALLAPTGIFLHVVSLRQAIASPERLGADPAWSPMRTERIAGWLPRSSRSLGGKSYLNLSTRGRFEPRDRVA